MADHYLNPYSNTNFFEFFQVLLMRCYQFLTATLEGNGMMADEIQMVVLGCVAVSAGLVGAFLMLRKMTMLANSISHTILVGIVGAFLLTKVPVDGFESGEGLLPMGALLGAALIMGIVTSLLTEFLTKTVRLQEDASLGLVFTTLFAIGILMVTLLTRNAHIGAEVVMGNVDALHVDDCKLVFLVMCVNIILIFIFYKQYKLTTFDSSLARALGFSTVFYNYLLMTQASATVVGAFRAVGVLMVLSFITGPALTARLLTNDLRRMLALAALLGVTASLVGVALSRHFLTVNGISLSTAGVVVCVIALQYLLVLFCVPSTGLIAKWRHRKKLIKSRAKL